jgi:hypothetical protein
MTSETTLASALQAAVVEALVRQADYTAKWSGVTENGCVLMRATLQRSESGPKFTGIELRGQCIEAENA